MEYSISRRQFIKGAFLSTLFLSSPLVLSGCSSSCYGTKIKAADLAGYELITHYTDLDKQTQASMFVKESINAVGTHYFYLLTTDEQDFITAQTIFSSSKENARERFEEYYFVETSIPALITLQDRIGIKSEYTAEELNGIASEIDKEINEQKSLTKRNIK